MQKEWEIGDSAYLKNPELGYRYVEIVGHDGCRLIIRITSGYVFSVYEDELEEY